METSTGAEFISEAHIRHVMRYVQARDWLTNSRYIADAACGTGYGSKLLAKAGHHVTGFDFDDAALEEANKSPVNHCDFVKMDLMAPMFQPQVDAVVSIETLEHVYADDGLTLLKQFHGWLRDPGILIVSTPYCDHSGPSPITLQHLWEYSLTDFEQALHLAGFEIDVLKVTRHDGKAGRRGYAMAKAIKR